MYYYSWCCYTCEWLRMILYDCAWVCMCLYIVYDCVSLCMIWYDFVLLLCDLCTIVDYVIWFVLICFFCIMFVVRCWYGFVCFVWFCSMFGFFCITRIHEWIFMSVYDFVYDFVWWLMLYYFQSVCFLFCTIV